jgi:hypothetical protein
MFRVIPRDGRGWLRVVLFLFQAFPIVASFVVGYFGSVWPHRTGWTMDDLKLFIIAGDFVCLIVVATVGIAQLFTGRRRRACVNLGLAALTVLLCFPLLNFVRA